MGIVVSAAIAAVPVVDKLEDSPRNKENRGVTDQGREEEEDAHRKLSRYHPSIYSPGKKEEKVNYLTFSRKKGMLKPLKPNRFY